MDPGHSMMAAHGAADGARSNGGGRAANSRWATDDDRAGGGGARAGDRELMSQGDGKDPEGQCGSDCSGDRVIHFPTASGYSHL